ncbi:MAG: hypothetical protein AAGG09_15980 [Pseudomonadota bacterium]
MTMIADILLIAGAFGAGLYCLVLSRRLTRFTDLEKGVGGAVAVLSVQVDDLKKALEDARTTAARETDRLEDVTRRAEDTARQLELQMASSFGEVPGRRVTAGDTPRTIRRRRRGAASDPTQEDAA